MNKLIVTTINIELPKQNTISKIIFAIFKDSKLEKFEIYTSLISLLNSVHVAKVKNIVRNINAAFLEIKSNDKNKTLIYYSLDSNKEHIFLNTKKNNVIHEGDDILVQIKKEALKTKLAQGSSKITVDENILKDILNKAKYVKSPALLYSDTYIFKDFIESNIDYIDEVICDIPEIYEQLKDFFTSYSIQLKLYDDKLISLTNLYSLNIRIKELLQKNIWLKSGAYLVIENTEAMNIIDVNTGKINIKKSKKETIKLTNIEAAKECINQIKLRNLYGIILIDFIDMKDVESKNEILDILKSGFNDDIIKTKVLGFTRLGLVEISREKKKRSLKEEIYL